MKKTIFKVILFCLCIVFIKNQYTPFLLRNATYGMPALIEKGKVDNLYIGSSMFRQGLDIHTLEKMQEDNYVLAYNGNQPVWEYLQLQHLLEEGVEIKNLYIDMYVYSAWNIPKIQDEKMFLEMSLKEKIKVWEIIASKSGGFGDLWRIFVSSNNELLLTWPISSVIINSQFYKGGTKQKGSAISAQRANDPSSQRAARYPSIRVP